MPNAHGSFIWYELMTKDPVAAKAFYDDVVGWDIDAAAPPGPMDYRMIKASDGMAGGVLKLDAESLAGGGRPMWLAYFGVDDVDATVNAIKADGGDIHLSPFDAPGVGRIAMASDPQGVPFYVMRGASDDKSTAYQRMGVGHVSWNELLTTDDAAALAFYEKHFNIEKAGEPMSMGDMGDYTFIANGDSKGDAVGAVMRAPPGAPKQWNFYFRVPDIDAAKAKIEARGGTILRGPMEVPGGEMVISAVDPEGVSFGLVATAKS